MLSHPILNNVAKINTLFIQNTKDILILISKNICIIMISGSKGQKAVRACTIRRLNLGPAKHEEVAIYAVNLRIPNV